MNEITFSVCSISWTSKNFSSSRFRKTSSPQTMSKRLIHEEKPRESERVVAKSKPMWNLVSETINSCPTALSSSTSYSTLILTAKSSSSDLTGMVKPVARDSNENAASSCQVVQSDVNPSSSAGTLVAKTTKNSVGTRLLSHSLDTSPSNVEYLKKSYSYPRRQLRRQLHDDMLELDVNMMIW